MLDEKEGVRERRMTPKFFVQTAGSIELPSIDDDVCGGDLKVGFRCVQFADACWMSRWRWICESVAQG